METSLKYFTADNWFFAINEKDIDAIKIFIEHDFDINVLGNHGKTALIIVSYKGDADYEIAKLLIDAGANLNIQDNHSNTALMLVLGDFNNSKNDIILLLLNAGADVNIRSNNGTTALIMASRNRNTEIVKFLLEGGLADLTHKGDGNTAFGWALGKINNNEVIRLLLDAGADSNGMRYGRYNDYIKEYKLNIIKKIKECNTLSVKVDLPPCYNDII